MKRSSGVLGVRIEGGLRETATTWAGASLLVELFRGSGLDGAAHKVLPAKGLKQGQTVESFVVLSALGGDCVGDRQHLRDDGGLTAILGYRRPPMIIEDPAGHMQGLFIV